MSVDLQVPRAPMTQVRLRPNSTGQASRKPDEVDTLFRYVLMNRSPGLSLLDYGTP